MTDEELDGFIAVYHDILDGSDYIENYEECREPVYQRIEALIKYAKKVTEERAYLIGGTLVKTFDTSKHSRWTLDTCDGAEYDTQYSDICDITAYCGDDEIEPFLRVELEESYTYAGGCSLSLNIPVSLIDHLFTNLDHGGD